ncbi:glycine betaine ABC transporter substrate-binding protein [Methanosarcina mazei]|jgi:osmoprotectant transport system substrate-binding protein|uniref:Glycine/betaine ABC transporter substrate-binding protein n=6 Tax=Methanosarcina mazei TaxID=2209 RepID=A0A0F8GWN4_METMZ|nr:glycine betaine ABC transporter substrate-binding protein [Methanosarcina mazei]AAM29994.1 Glycine betaine-binding protein [Methanosarcina mazei Go1]AKB39981.1 L-proline glycine betaine binding ABC transporter protein ProX [Methanosarcina mazei WWM610]AKB60942.1 L-proline glycine betaine binding ABC transporter protein ProX [Methanosarcina mazei SarPi]AKB64198.1 L-proline glycine betaine binding ABC transporter protein ProX [Methanosarcina mazei S-6]AKB67545.1 L-proline glycine betaine bind
MKFRFIIVLLLAASLFFSGCAENNQNRENNTQPAEKVVIGTKLFQESYITAHMVSLLLEEQGYDTEVKENLGGTLVNYEALKKGDIQSYIEYTGTIYSQILKKPPLEEWDPEVVYEESEKGMLESDGVVIASSLGFEDAYAIAVDREWAENQGINTISDLEPYASEMSVGTDPEFATREDGLPQLARVYGFSFKNYNSMAPGIMYEAMENNEVDAISAYTTDTRNDLYGLKVLEDDKHALPPYDAVVLVTESFAEDNPEAMEALSQLNGRIDQDTMRRLNGEYDIEGRSAKDIARDYLIEEGLISS